MVTALDPHVLRARTAEHAARPTALRTVVLAGPDEAVGLTDAREVPLMTLDLRDCTLAESPSAGVERVVDAAGIEEVAELTAAAFGLRRAVLLERRLHEAPGLEAWLLRESGHAVSSVVATSDPDLVGIWSMATAPTARRAGRATKLLRAVLGHYALCGAQAACLVATPAGEPLYRSLGFTEAERVKVWIKP
jgi:ribosomal protein S18 acetylase RimI-like enzyme